MKPEDNARAYAKARRELEDKHMRDGNGMPPVDYEVMDPAGARVSFDNSKPMRVTLDRSGARYETLAESAPMSAGGRSMLGEGGKVALVLGGAGMVAVGVIYVAVGIIGPLLVFIALAAAIIVTHRFATQHVGTARDDISFANGTTWIAGVALVLAGLVVAGVA